MERLAKIRQKEKEYHDQCYENTELFTPGTWLHKPVKSVMDTLERLENLSMINILDLGCGIGRNSIPLAQKLKHKDGSIVCVDLLESAINKLKEYSEKYEVSEKMQFVLSDIADYAIPQNHFNLILSVSAIEHLESEVTFDSVLQEMVAGTKDGGINCLIISTNVKETVVSTGEALDPMYELLFTTDDLISKLQNAYRDWSLMKQTVKPYQVEITRDGRKVNLEGDVVTWTVQKPLIQ